LNGAGLRKNFAAVAARGDEVPLFFYSDLFIKHPDVREMFPISTEAQRGHLVDALGKIVCNIDSSSDLTPFLEALGRDHRRFGALAEHYDAVGASLLATLEYFSGPSWTPELRSDWTAAYELVGSVMAAAAEVGDSPRPPCMASDHVHIDYLGRSAP
jgi:hemoglobin-like flavoprotein